MESSTHSQLFINEIKALVVSHFGLVTEIKMLAGEADRNFRLTTSAGAVFLLKISPPSTIDNSAAIEFEQAIMTHLQAKNLPFQTPQVVSALNGNNYIFLERQDTEHFQNCYLRLQTWVKGRMLDKAKPRTHELLNEWGRTCGHLSVALRDFDHPIAHRLYKWNPSETLAMRPCAIYFQQEEEREIGDYFWNLFTKAALPELKKLRTSVNYNDAHEHNLLINNHAQISGVIDFGDALYTQTINELAIACAYAGMKMPDPLAAMQEVVRGYHRIFPIEEKELAVLFPLITARLLITAANSAYQKHHDPENTYLQISEKPCWILLKKLRLLHPDFVHYSFRAVCDFEPCPKRHVYDNYQKNKQVDWHPLVDFSNQKAMPFDLSVGSLDLGNNANFLTVKAFHRTVTRLLEDNATEIGVGGYAEIRPFYTTDAYLIEGNDGPRWRTQHLGLDIWTTAETPVFAPLTGTVHSFQNNAADCDYGPTIILKHQLSEELTFYTLYGHLTLDSLDNLEVGMTIERGQPFCKIGDFPVNGNWSPHLHFQIILNLFGKNGDYPGVAFPSEIKTWLSTCPPPPSEVSTLNGQNTEGYKMDKNHHQKIKSLRQKHLASNLSLSYDQPLHIVRGYQQYLYDENARRYLDTCNNVPHVGHQHPRIVRAAQRQIGVLNTNTRYLHQNIVHYAEALLATFPAALEVAFFVNSGSEANELALRLAQTYTQQKDILAIEIGYHGNTNGTIGVSSYKFDGKGGTGAPAHTHVIPLPDTYRGLYRDPLTAGEKYAAHAGEQIDKLTKLGRQPAAFIGESIISCGGQIVLPVGYLKAVYQQVRAAGGVCIADEVQVGFGRVGTHFWGFELQDVVPDIVTLGKPIGNGHPLAAVVTTRKIAAAFANGMEYFNTFGGNPVSCAIGAEVLQVIREENLQENALKVGHYLIEKLRTLQQQFPIIGDVRGHGLFLGFELVTDRKQRTPAPKQAKYLANRMRELGVLMSTDGPDYNVIKIKPPLCFSIKDADFLVEKLRQVLGEEKANLNKNI